MTRPRRSQSFFAGDAGLAPDSVKIFEFGSTA
jgi:hypothetical protein